MKTDLDFVAFPKIPRLFRECVITEKIDGSNAAVRICELPGGNGVEATVPFDDAVYVQTAEGLWHVTSQSRKRSIAPRYDNFGFAAWVWENAAALVAALGEGHHFGEWWGQGIQRRYGLDHKRFSLFNVARWADVDLSAVPGLHVVPVLYAGPFDTAVVNSQVTLLSATGSKAAPGWMQPEGIIVWHEAGRQMFKVTVEHDEKPKGEAA